MLNQLKTFVCKDVLKLHFIFVVAILLGTLRMPYKDVRDMVLSVDEHLTEQMLGQLLKYMPKKEEVSC